MKLSDSLTCRSPNSPKTQSPNNSRIVFFGSSNYVLPVIEALRKNFDLSLVITTENPKNPKDNLASQGDALRGYLRDCPVIKYCIENKIPYLSVSNLSDSAIINKLTTVNPKAGVLADFGLIIPEEILNAFPKGIINIHPSLLPKYRGPTPVQTAILNGKHETGVSIMKLDKEIDHGPILKQEKEEILSTDTSETLYKRLFAKGANLLPKVLNEYIEGSLKPTPQNHENATFTKPLTRQDGFINLPSLKIANCKLKIERIIRAYYPWPGIWFKAKLNGAEKVIKLLPGNKIQVEGKKPMSYKDFLNGYPKAKEILEILQK